MNFFEQQDRSRRKTHSLVVLYVLAVLGTAVTLHAGIALLWWWLGEKGEEAVSGTVTEALLQSELALWVFTLTFLVIGVSSLYKLITLRAGGASVAESMGGREVMPSTRDLRERRLLNVVEEMAIAAGISMPRVFILDNEGGMNAFAAGFSSKDAAVAVTRGLLGTLNRDELQAVIGHEFSHILNGDMRLNIRLIAVLYGIYAITILGVFIMRIAPRLSSGRSRSKDGKDYSAAAALAVLQLGLVVWLVGRIGFFFGRLIQYGISRQREFLADASAVQFTRNPEGLANALKLIGAKTGQGKLLASNVSAVSHMLFTSGMSSMFATHPPLRERIRRVEPGFNGSFIEARNELHRRLEAQNTVQKAKDENMDAEDERIIRNTMYGVRRALRYEAPGAQAARLPNRRHAGEPPALPGLSFLSDEDRDMLHDPLSAQCCVCGALLDTDERIRALQLTMLPHRFANDTEMTNGCLAWQERMKGWTVRQRRIACELAVATLRGTAPDRLKPFCAGIDKLVRADNMIEPFEFALMCMIRRRLQTDATLAHARQSTVSPSALAAEIARVLSMIAAFDATAQAAQDAWAAGVQRIVPYTGQLVMLETGSVRDFDAFDAALSKLERLPPLFKREFMLACQTIVMHDGVTTETEDCFIFAVADAIDAIGWNVTI